MKRALVAVLSSLLFTSVASADPTPAPIRPTVPITPVSPVPTLRIPIKPILTCPDPAAMSVDFQLTARTSRFAGRVRVTGAVKNAGGAPFVSGANQQSAQLWELVPGGRPRLVARRSFQNLAPGEMVSVTYERAWNASSPAEGEFPPSYRLIVSYDPDILIDGNTKNDDCVSANNSRERSGTGVNALFR